MKAKQYNDYKKAKEQACKLIKYHGYKILEAVLASVTPTDVKMGLQLRDELKEIF